MKKSLLYILAVLVGSLLFGACDKHDSASDPDSYSEFIFKSPSFNSISGAKVYWDDDGLWWSPSGDLVLINGNLYQITKGTDPNTGATQWKTVGGLLTFKVDDNFFCCYIGQTIQSPSWDEENKIYHNVNLENIVPLVGESRDNLMTLKPCCAVLKIINLDRDISKIVIPVTLANKFPYSGDIDPVNALVANPGNKKNQFDNIAPINRTAYVILPMVCNSITTTGQLVFQYKEGGTTITKKTRSAVTINKGYIYVIDFAQLQGN